MSEDLAKQVTMAKSIGLRGGTPAVSPRVVRMANMILAGGAAAALFSLSYFVYYYAYTRQRQFTDPLGAFLCYDLPGLLALLLFASLRLRPAHKVNLALVFISVLACLYGGELVLLAADAYDRYWPSQITDIGGAKTKAIVAKRFGIDFDTRTRLEVITDLRNKGVDAVPAIGPSTLLKRYPDGTVRSVVQIGGREVMPLSGIANKTTVHCNENGEFTIYRSDEHGFNNPPGIWSSGPFAVGALGDSFTHGSCVPSDKNFVGLIRNRYPATLNLGIKGMGPLLELAVLKEYLTHAKPRVVLWFYFEKNDFYDLRKEEASNLLMRYLGEKNFSQGLFNRQNELDQALTKAVEKEIAQRLAARSAQLTTSSEAVAHLQNLVSFIKLSRLRKAAGLVYGKETSDTEPSEALVPDIGRFREILLQADRETRAWGGRLYFVYLPEWERYAYPESAPKHRQLVLQLVTELGLPLIDLDPVFKAQKDPLSLFPFRGFGHYNEDGHRLVAETVMRFIKALESGT